MYFFLFITPYLFSYPFFLYLLYTYSLNISLFIHYYYAGSLTISSMSLIADDAGETTALHHLRLQLPKTTAASGWRAAVLCTGRPDDGWDVLLQSDDESTKSAVLSGNYSLYVGGTSPRRFRSAEGQIIVPHQKLPLSDFSFTQSRTQIWFRIFIIAYP